LRWRFLSHPGLLALVVTLVDAAKPVLVDDPVYLRYARHMAQHPLDPYGFVLLWYDAPQPAMEVLCPPVLPCWLALGTRLVGEAPALLKLWLFPLVWLLAWSLRELLRRFARGTESSVLPLVVLSPAVLPMVNVMLDVPAVAIGLAAIALFVRAAERESWPLAALAGVVAALAMQTKYTMLIVPPVLAWYGLTHRRLRLAAAAVGVAVLAFAAWEWLLWEGYGRSHFLFHVREQQRERAIAEGLRDKAGLLPPLVAHLGCLAVAVGLYAGRAVGVRRGVLVAAAVLWVVGVGLVASLPYETAVLVRGKEPGFVKLTLTAVVWRTAGAAVLVLAAGCAAMLLVRRPRGRRDGFGLRMSADSAFVVGWVLIELAGYFGLTPFPAARRVVGLTVALGVLAARTVSRVSRARPDRRPPRWVVPFGVAIGVAVAALDTFDAFPEKVIAERAAAVIAERDGQVRVWYSGRWGFQYYCERAGMRPAVAGQSELMPGDYLVLPVFPDSRPHDRRESVHTLRTGPGDAAELVAELVWDDALPAQTVPNFYGGNEPVIGRGHPRLRVRVYRLTRPWAVPPEEVGQRR
jgi:hypothetical protein